MEGRDVADETGLVRHLAGLRAAAERLAGSEDEDLLQECLASAMPALGSVRTPAVLGAWLRQILRRRWYDRLRRRSLERRVQDELRPPDPQAELFAGSARVRSALGALDGEARRVLDLRFFQSKSSVEIARKLGRPAGTVRPMIFHALRKFESEYERACQEESE
jgi:RNA polymerase sigma factor (sigma-70 family)